MTPSSAHRPDVAERRARGRALRQARRARVAGIRHRVVASTLALFMATWLLIAMLLVTGHDPALATNRPSRVTTKKTAATTSGTSSTPSTTTTTTTTTSSSTPTTTTSSSASSGSGASSSPTSLTSSQS